MSSQRFLFYVSGHGFGHARRTAAVIEHLLRSRPRIDVWVRTAEERHARAQLDGIDATKN